MIAATKNLKDKTELEVVGYPFDSGNRPDVDAAPTGRFLVIQSGYLETADYAPGRLITVVGMVTETRTGTVGEAQYVYPVVAANKLQLWPRSAGGRNEPSIHFGIGIGIIR
jgi:outer membrane lipoprotein